MKKDKTGTFLLLIGILFMGQSIFSQIIKPKDTLYFDSSWKTTTRTNHEFYRILPLETIGNVSLIKDFYKNGNMQMQGYAYTDSLNVHVGDVYWYDKNGFDTSSETNFNPTNRALKYYHDNGKIWKTIVYKNAVKHGEIKAFNNKGTIIATAIFKEGFILKNTIGKFHTRYYSGKYNKAKAFKKKRPASLKDFTKILYWMHTGNVARRTEYKNNKIVEEHIYDKKGALIKHLYQNDFIKNEPLNGTYYKFKTKNGFIVELIPTENKNIKNKIIQLNNISHISAYNRGNLQFYQQKGDKGYSKVNYKLYHNEKIPESSFRLLEKNNGYSSIEDIKKRSSKVINVNDIKIQSVASLLKSIRTKEWSNVYLKPNGYSGNSMKHKVLFKQLNSTLFTHLDLSFTKATNGGFGSSYKKNDDDIKKWRLNSLEFYTINILVLNDNKPILFLRKDDEVSYYIIPIDNEGLYVNFRENNPEEKQATNIEESVFKEMMLYSRSNQFYSINSTNDQKYIANSFNEILIDTPYDSIQRTGQYIIGRNTKNIEVYNLNLDKLPLEKVRQVYYDRGNLQILTKNNIKYVDALGGETNRQLIDYSFCGTVSSTDFTLIKSKKNKNINAVEIKKGNFGRDYLFKKILLLGNLDAKYELTFFNKTKKEGYDGNSGFVEGYINRTNLLIVSKDEKKGLYSYNDKDVKFKYEKEKKAVNKKLNGLIEPPDIINMNTPSYGKTDAVQLLPVIYDDIISREPLIIVKKGDVYGIYPLKEEPKYKVLGKVEGNFISYETITGEKGWIDVNTLKEYTNRE